MKPGNEKEQKSFLWAHFFQSLYIDCDRDFVFLNFMFCHTALCANWSRTNVTAKFTERYYGLIIFAFKLGGFADIQNILISLDF